MSTRTSLPAFLSCALLLAASAQPAQAQALRIEMPREDQGRLPGSWDELRRRLARGGWAAPHADDPWYDPAFGSYFGQAAWGGASAATMIVQRAHVEAELTWIQADSPELATLIARENGWQPGAVDVQVLHQGRVVITWIVYSSSNPNDNRELRQALLRSW